MTVVVSAETRAKTAADSSFAETRALWVTRFELVDTPNIPALVKRAAESNFNTLFVQVCGRGTAFYESKILPKDTRVSHDALAMILAEAQKYKISVHAWINTLYVWSDLELPVSPEHVVNKHPEWIMALRGDGRNKYLDPAIPEAREYLKSIYLEVARNYAVDGVHLDYVRYPGAGAGFTEYSQRTFERLYGVDPLALYQNKEVALRLFGAEEYQQKMLRWDDWRRESINSLVRGLFYELTIAAPKVILTAAVLPDPDSAAKNNFQDWAAWMRGGYIDAIAPMIYDRDARVVQKQIVRAAELADEHSVPVFVGLGAWRRSADAIVSDVEFLRRAHREMDYKYLRGVVLFSYDGIKNVPDYLEHIKRHIFVEQAAQSPPREKRFLSEENPSVNTGSLSAG
ncbi:putative lipoprotein YddW [Candidatus Termititenax aidoneus]|uniref:Lipoprotein YddW n=1 Tax=Termititenax aidoneus TaxID=2218524 RepID=A0A388TCN4_TERA1|nr:putative lipoprotein YddW [Candidatus Termititenax aidoneus]